MKKVIALVLALVLVMSLALTACAENIKIGVSIWSSTDTLGSECKRIIDAAAEALGDVEVQYVDQAHISEQVTASAETLAMADCDGIIICNSASAEMGSVIKTCEDNEVYVAQFFRVIDPEANPDEYAQASASPYYVGAVHESEFDNGKTLVTILGEKGCRKIGLEGWEPGDATFLGRWDGYKAGVEAWNEAHADDKMEMLEPHALIVAGGGGDTLLGAIAGIEAKGLTGKIAVVSTDFLPDLDVKLQTGAMAAESGGHYADPFFAFLMVYNAVKGNYEVKTDGFYDMVFPYMYVASPEDYANYAEYFTGDQLPYTADEIKELAGLSYEDLAAACAKLSVEDVVARHTK